MSTLRAEYERRLAARSAAAARHGQRAALAYGAQLAAAALLALSLALAAGGSLTPPFVLAALVALGAAFAGERALVEARDRSERAAALYRASLARLEGRWEAVPFTGAEFLPADHPFAFDLDLVGERSLFARLSAARTRAGARTLAGWLLEPAGREERPRRQEAVAELRGRLDLREALHGAGPAGATQTDGDLVAAWTRRADHLPWPWLRLPLAAVAWALVAAAAGAALGWWSGLVPVAAGLAVALLHLWLRRRAGAVAAEAAAPLCHLSAAAAMMAVVEREEFRSPLLRELHSTLTAGGRASEQVARLGRRVAVMEAMGADLGAAVGLQAVGYPLLWPARQALAIEAWRRAHGARAASWFRALGTVEALLSIAAFADEHPDFRFAEVLDVGPLVEAEGLGHPLLPGDRCVANDVRLGGEGPHLLLLSGSNMSGKSTLLRAVGMSAAMALAGIPVRAARLQLSPLSLGASLRLKDSLLDGESRFYAELRRLRQVVDLAERGRPVLFLLDELLGGTNSRDRLAGASGLLRGLLARGAIGLCTTHDLALTHIAEELGPRAANGHFGDRLDGERLVFDYRLRPGVSRQTNAMELLRAMGLGA